MSGTTPGVSIDPHGKKTFIPLENNPDIFTGLAHRLGLSKDLEFHDVFSFTDSELLALVPRPVLALIFIAPPDVYHRVRASDRELNVQPSEKYDGSGDGEPVVWIKQTIGHSCGLMALIHSIANGPAKEHIEPGSLIDRILEEAVPLRPEARAAVLYDSLELEQAHMAYAIKGDTAAPPSTEPAVHHFISFLRSQKNGHLYELEGATNGPIDRGAVDEQYDPLTPQAIALSLDKYMQAAQGNLEFSLIALTAK